MPTITYKTREQWLNAAIKSLRPMLKDAGANDLPQMRISCGWSKRARGSTIGVCWHSECSADQTNEILISPELDDATRVLDVVAHELIHASDNGASKHRGYFATTAKALGLTGKMTATVAGDELRATLEALASKLGPYPHAALTPGARVGKQSTRMIKVVCLEDGYTVRTTRKWIEVGTPTCPCGAEMREEI